MTYLKWEINSPFVRCFVLFRTKHSGDLAKKMYWKNSVGLEGLSSLLTKFLGTQQKIPWLITKLFVIKQRLFFLVIYHKPLFYWNEGMQECFVINFGKWWFVMVVCDSYVYDVYDKYKIVVYHIVLATVINFEKHTTF